MRSRITAKLDFDRLERTCLCVAEYSRVIKQWLYYDYEDSANAHAQIDDAQKAGRPAIFTNFGMTVRECNV